MGKFRRLSMEEARNEFPLLNEEARKALKGGCDLHDFFGGAHSYADLLDAAKQGAHCIMWVCDTGLVEVENGDWVVLESANHFHVCSHHPEQYLLFGADCLDCNNEGRGYCNTHQVEYTLSHPCIGCEPTYCTTHYDYFYYNEGCNDCIEDCRRWESEYPDGCFEHKKTEYCYECK